MLLSPKYSAVYSVYSQLNREVESLESNLKLLAQQRSTEKQGCSLIIIVLARNSRASLCFSDNNNLACRTGIEGLRGQQSYNKVISLVWI